MGDKLPLPPKRGRGPIHSLLGSLISAWKFGGFPLFLASHSRLPASFKDVLEVTLLEAITVHIPTSFSRFFPVLAAAPNFGVRGSPVIELQTVLSGHTAFSAPETKTDKEENKQQPVAILAQEHRCCAHKNRYLLPISLFAFHSHPLG